MRSAGTYRVRSSGKPVAREMLDLAGDVGGTIYLLRSMGLGAINCNPFPFTGGQGLTDPTCWCLTVGPTVCDTVAGKGTYAAAMVLNSGDVPSPAPPPIVPAIDPNTPPPSNAAEANATINSVIAQQWQAWKDQNSAFFTSVANTADAAGGGGGGGTGLSTMGIAAIAVGILAVGLLLFTPSISVVPARRR